jgi:hypothetical protein
MSRRKRTQAQVEFDLAKHGWAFCNADALRRKILRLEELAKQLQPDDARHAMLAHIREQYLHGWANTITGRRGGPPVRRDTNVDEEAED